MAALTRQYPPYSGNDPYLFLCFSKGSGKKARMVLDRLYRRGVRVWYFPEGGMTRAEREESDRRMLSAALTVILLDEAFRNDPAAKSRLLACQEAGRRIVCLNTDGGDSGLSIGLHAGAEEIRFPRGASAGDLERELLHADGFSRELIGEPIRAGRPGFRAAVTVMLALAALLFGLGLYRYFSRPQEVSAVPQGLAAPAAAVVTPEPTDSVVFQDETVREAVRNALGGGLLTGDRLKEVRSIRLEGDALPDSLADLALLPSLETVLLSQSAAKDVPDREELTGYTIELYGGTP